MLGDVKEEDATSGQRSGDVWRRGDTQTATVKQPAGVPAVVCSAAASTCQSVPAKDVAHCRTYVATEVLLCKVEPRTL